MGWFSAMYVPWSRNASGGWLAGYVCMYVCMFVVGISVLRRIGLVGWVVVEDLWVGVVLVWRVFLGLFGGGLWGSWGGFGGDGWNLLVVCFGCVVWLDWVGLC